MALRPGPGLLSKGTKSLIITLFRPGVPREKGAAEIKPIEPVWVMPAKGAASDDKTFAISAKSRTSPSSAPAWSASASLGGLLAGRRSRCSIAARPARARAMPRPGCWLRARGGARRGGAGRARARQPGALAGFRRRAFARERHRCRAATRGHAAARLDRGRSGGNRASFRVSATSRLAARMAVGCRYAQKRAASGGQDRRRAVLASGSSGR